MSKKIFITFGAGGDNYVRAGKRLTKQAEKTSYFDKVILYGEKYLRDDKEFWNKHEKFILNNKRGYGYWIWKSYIIKRTLENMEEGDILMYLDCGCEIGEKKQSKIKLFFDFVKKHKIIATHVCVEKDWNKMDLVEFLEMKNSKKLNQQQIQSGALLFYKDENTKKIIDLWYEISCDYHLIDDTPSLKPNLQCFREHRHDQSILSLLIKKYNLWCNKTLFDCIYYSRNRDGNTLLKS